MTRRYLVRSGASSQSARIRRHVPHCGGGLVCRAAAPLRVVKMRRRSFTPRFASKTIRSLAHFHSAWMKADKSARTEGPAIAALCANRVAPHRRYSDCCTKCQSRWADETCAGNAPLSSRSGRIASGITWRRRGGAVLALVREGGGNQYSRVGRSIKESGQMPAFSFCFSMGSVSCFVGMGTEAAYRGDGVEGGEVFRVEGEGEDVGVLDYAGGRGGFGQGKDAVF